MDVYIIYGSNPFLLRTEVMEDMEDAHKAGQIVPLRTAFDGAIVDNLLVGSITINFHPGKSQEDPSKCT